VLAGNGCFGSANGRLTRVANGQFRLLGVRSLAIRKPTWKSVIKEATMILARTPRLATLLWLAPVFALCMVSSSSADEGENSSSTSLSTPPLTIGTSLVCIAANVGKTPLTLDIELHDVNGTVVVSQRCALPPGAVNAGGSQCSVVEGAPAGFVGYCTFTVIHGSKQHIRAAILSQNANLGIGAQPAALPAQ
jgi:hypothetical protein